jgi:hypothetical protein
MAAFEPYGFRHGGHRSRDANKRFPVIRARRCRPAERNDREDREMFNVMLGLRVLSCFSPECPTLTSEEIACRLDLLAQDVTSAARRLACLGYLAVDPPGDENAWVLVPDDG